MTPPTLLLWCNRADSKSAGGRCGGKGVKREEVDKKETGEETLMKELKAGETTSSKTPLLLIRTQLGEKTPPRSLN